MGVKKYFRRSTQWQLVVATAATCGLLQILQRTVTAPYFEKISGFTPLDIQFPLGSVALAIQLGAYGEGAASAYMVFAASEILIALTVAVFFLVLWRWMFSVSPNGAFIFLRRGGILIAPFAAVVCDIAETAGFARLISGVPESFYESTMEFSVLMHRLKFIFQDIRIYFTLFFASTMAVQFVRRVDVRPPQ
jgi:hypothetical protein